MKLLFKQRFFSWLDSYDIYDEAGRTVYTVKGKLSWGHCLKIYDAYGSEIATVKERVLTFLPKFEMYLGERCIGTIQREWGFRPRYRIDYRGWQVTGNWVEWEYDVQDYNGLPIAHLSKELWNLTDTYMIDVADPRDALCVLMLALAIDAEKCSRSG